MNIPPSCQDWVNILVTPDPACVPCDCPQIVLNIQNDPCVPPDIEREFFGRISASPPGVNHFNATGLGIEAAKGEPPVTSDLRFCGRSVPGDRFQNLTRFFTADALWYVLGEDFVADKHGLSKAELKILRAPELNRLLRGATSLSTITVGKERDPVFVAEESTALTAARSSPVNLVALLGLPWLVDHLQAGSLCVESNYSRSALPGETLHVPRVLDSLNFPPFRPNTDLDAPCGITKPVPPASGDGLPEAIHRPCAVAGFELKSLTP